MSEFVDPEGPNGWIQDECPECRAKSGERCKSASGRERSEPHMAREHEWSARRVRESS